MGFADRVRKEKTEMQAAKDMYLVRGNDSTEKPAWYYLRVAQPKQRRFELDARKGQIQLTDYGKIIISGYGKEVPEHVRKRMKDEYGFED